MIRFGRLAVVFMCLALAAHTVFSAAKTEGDNFEFSVSTSVEYSDNRDSWEVEEEDNVDLFISPRLQGILEKGTTRFDFFYQPSYRYRTNPSDIQNDSQLYHNLGVRYEHQMKKPFKVSLDEKFNVTDDPSVQKNGSTLRRDSSFIYNRINAGISYIFSRRSDVGAYVNHYIKAYDESERADESDEDSIGAGVNAWRQFSRSMGVLVDVRYYDQNYNENLGVDRGFSAVDVKAGLRKSFGNNLLGEGSVGFSSLGYTEEGLDNESAPLISVKMQYSPTPKTVVLGALGYGLKKSDVFPFPSQKAFDFYTSAQWDSKKQWLLSADCLVRLGNYEDENVTPSGATYLADRGRDTDGQETAVIISGTASYKLSADSSIKLIQRHENVDSDVSLEFTRNSTSIGFSKQF